MTRAQLALFDAPPRARRMDVAELCSCRECGVFLVDPARCREPLREQHKTWCRLAEVEDCYPPERRRE